MLTTRLRESLEALGEAGANALKPPYAAVAWSGGADSTALLLAYLEMLGETPQPLLAIHVDHKIREDSAEDVNWCRARSKALGHKRVCFVALELTDEDLVGGQGPKEGPARDARYRLLADAVQLRGHTAVLTAHHADDNIESLLLALVRGAGLTGLAGTRAQLPLHLITGRKKDSSISLIRPLLGTAKEELKLWLETRGETWREDPTNKELNRRRNILRHEIVPRLKTLADSPKPMWRTLRVLARDRDLVERLASLALQKVRRPRPHHHTAGLALSIQALTSIDGALARHVLRAAFKEASSTRPYPPDEASIDRVLTMISKGAGGSRSLQVAGDLNIVAERTLVIIGARPRTPPPSRKVPFPGEVQWGNLTIRASLTQRTQDPLELRAQVETFDLGALSLPLRVRSPLPGERFRKWGGARSA